MLDLKKMKPDDPRYRMAIRRESFVPIAREMLAYKNKYANTGSVELLRDALLFDFTPTLDEIFHEDNNEYSLKTIRNRKTDFRKSAFFDEDDRLRDSFLKQYFERVRLLETMTDDVKIAKQESLMINEIELNKHYSYDDVIFILKQNPDIKFKFPDTALAIRNMNFNDPRVQFVTLNHIGTEMPVPFHIHYHYQCNACEHEIHTPTALKSVKCPMPGCEGAMKKIPEKDLVLGSYASQVMYESTSLPVISLVPIPQGEFTGASILCRDTKNTKYYVLLLAVHEREYVSTELTFDKSEHVIWQMIEQIDNIHKDRLDGCIEGLDYLKAAVILMAISNAAGFKSFNVLVAGRQGIGKTVTGLLYMNTLSRTCKVQDAATLTLPGIIGSTTTIDVNNQRVQVREPGLLVRNDLVVIDEMFAKQRKILGDLKNALSSASLTKEVAGNRSEVPKNACVMATANIDPEIYIRYQEKFREYMEIYQASPETFLDFSDVTGKAVAANPLCHDAGQLISEVIRIECMEHGINWIDGQALPDLDRFVLIFYMGDVSKEDRSKIDDYLHRGVNTDMPNSELQERIFTQEIREYIQYCATAEVDIDSDQDEIVKFAEKILKIDHIHSPSRLLKYIKYMLRFSAALNQRTVLNKMDFEFVEELLMHTCRWFEPEELVRGQLGPLPAAEVVDFSEERDPSMPVPVSKVVAFIDQKFERYDMYNLSQQLWDRAIENIMFDIEREFQFLSVDDIKKIMNEYVENHGGRPDDVFADVEVFDAKTGSRIPFGTVPMGISPKDVLNIFINEFMEFGYVTKEALDEFSTKQGLAKAVVSANINIMREKGLIIDVGQAYKWK